VWQRPRRLHIEASHQTYHTILSYTWLGTSLTLHNNCTQLSISLNIDRDYAGELNLLDKCVSD
jgi:hypothetical protein